MTDTGTDGVSGGGGSGPLCSKAEARVESTKALDTILESKLGEKREREREKKKEN